MTTPNLPSNLDPDLADLDWDVFLERVLWDVLQTATSIWWTRRAVAFEWARPRAGDFTGQATTVETAALDSRLAATAQACRNRARLVAGEFGG